MLDTETKRKIDSARDILVGKVPDPKAQIDQITTALIYKFMDDMDREAEELGGKAKFITGELEAYQWSALMSKELSGEARLNLYMSALLVFSKAQNIPEIFRIIFKDAFLPYRDPETLNLFLKQIDYFDYDHSENLGNAFEYLLSVLGSQGDAGQFRTPRHIIDFIVEIIEPKKTDTVLDPSCGTAGFLISAYKHILANETLTPEDKKRLMENFTGYDISPDMVRLSLVNLYLHSFPSPKVYEYDTLTSEDRWDESYNIILANPPFMTPKGGIRPHNRFSVQAKRSEVLFVDYIAEHLNLNGRAGIIVPEGIIFQSANAYKSLRKMLVDNGFLWAVVSLPAGVFQPYSGVKTSILLLDRAIAKQHDSILFIKINQDGFDLGAQRRENTHSELPIALELLKTYRTGGVVDNALATVVLKTKIAETGDYNLTGERYKETVRHDGVYPMVKLGDICEIGSSKRVFEAEWKKEGVPFYRAREIVKLANQGFVDNELFISEEMFHDYSEKYGIPCEGDLMVTGVGTLGICYRVRNTDKFYFKDGNIIWLKKFSKNVNSKFVRCLFDSDMIKDQIKSFSVGGTVGTYTITSANKTEIPLPPLEIQNAIVAEIEQWQKVIDGAKQVIANYRPTITINPDWEMVKLKDVCETITDGDHQAPPKASTGVPFVTITNINKENKLDFTKTFFVPETYYLNLKEFRKPKLGDILYTVTGSYGIPVLIETETRFCFQRHIALIRTKPVLSNKFLYGLLMSPFINKQAVEAATGVAQKTVSLNSLRSFIIPLPPIETQNTLVEQIEKERAAVDACKTLVALFEAKIKTKIAEVWGESQTKGLDS